MKTLTKKTLTGIEEIDTKRITNELSLTCFLILAKVHNLSDELVTNFINEVWPNKKSIQNEDVTVIKQQLKDGAWKHVFKKHPDPAIRTLCITPACEDIFDELVYDEDLSVRMAFLNNSSLFIVNNYYPILAQDPDPTVRKRMAGQGYHLKKFLLDEDPDVVLSALRTLDGKDRINDKEFEDVLKEVKHDQDYLIQATTNPRILEHLSEHALEAEDREMAAFKVEMLYKMQNMKQDCLRSGLVHYHDVYHFLYDLLVAN